MRRSGNNDNEEGEEVENPREAWKSLEIEEYGPCFMHNYTQFFMTSQPLDYFDDLTEYLYKNQADYRISGSTLRLKFTTTIAPPASPEAAGSEEEKKEAPNGRMVKVDVQVLKVNDNKHCVKFSYKDPEKKLDLQASPDLVRHFMGIRDSKELRMFCDTTFDEVCQ